MKKKTLFIILAVIILVTISTSGYFIYKGLVKKQEEEKIKNAIVIINLKDNLETEFLSEVHVSDFIEYINGTLVDDYKIDTKTIGEKEIKFEYINDDNIKLKKSYKINIVDKIAPIVWMGSSYTVTVGSNVNIADKVMCGDNYDANPTCEIIGEYDMSTAGTYPLTFKATDSSGNTTEKAFNLYVKKPTPSTGGNNNNGTTHRTNFSDIVATHKKTNTQIGLDLSEWQGEVDFDKIQAAGVEFVILRVGGTKGIKGDYFLDKQFVRNITEANKRNIPVGVYFYSYANSKEKALKDAEWIYEQIKDYQVDLGVAFDWENWSFYNEFNLSFFGLTDMANSFLDFFKDLGYEGLLYSSKSYLEQIWLKTDYPIWLAHYTTQTNYKGTYNYWQACSDGKIDGVNGPVDINIRYMP